MVSVSKTYWQIFLAQGVCTGLGNGLIFTPVMAVITTYFNKKRGIAAGLAACGSTVGGLIFPSMAKTLLPSIGFGWTMRAIGFIQLGTLAVGLAIIRARPIPKHGKKGPMVDWSAFKEPEYSLYAAGTFLVCFDVLSVDALLWNVESQHGELVRLLIRFSDFYRSILSILLSCNVCSRHSKAFLPRFFKSNFSLERCRHSRTYFPRLLSTSTRHVQCICYAGGIYFANSLLLGCSLFFKGALRVDGILQSIHGRHPVSFSCCSSSFKIRRTETGDAHGHGI